MKKLLGIVLALALLLSCTAALADPVKLTYAEVNPLDGTIVGEMAKAFKAKAEELSGGEIEIDIQAGGVLGSEDQILDNLLGGGNITDISRISAFALTQYGCSKASLLSIPYTFVNEEHFWKFADSELAQEFLLEPQELGLGLRGLCYGEEGFRHFFFKNEVKTVAFTELYSALNTGVVDGAEQPTANYRSNAFQEVAPYLLLDGHTLGALQIIITDAAWNKLSEQQQGWIMEASKYASQVCREKVAEIEAQTFELLKQDGATVIEVEDKTPWVEACQETIKKNTEAQADLYQKILDMQ